MYDLIFCGTNRSFTILLMQKNKKKIVKAMTFPKINFTLAVMFGADKGYFWKCIR